MVIDLDNLGLSDTSIDEPEPIPDPLISVIDSDDVYGKFSIEPLKAGYGITLGNPLRRVLYSSLPGTAITWVKIDGVLHEYGTIPLVKEEVFQFLLNVKSIRIKNHTERAGKLRLEVSGAGEVSAGDIMTSADFEIINPELHLATMDSDKASLTVEMNVENGTGYVVSQNDDGQRIGVLPVDSVFTPTRKVNFKIEPMRIGQVTNYERLVIEIWTDRSISPMEAIQQAGSILVNEFFAFANIDKAIRSADEKTPVALKMPAEHYNVPVEDLELSSRTLNCLKRSGLNRVGDVLEESKSDLLKMRNFGVKSYNELLDSMRTHGLLPDDHDPENESDTQETNIENK
jgi:DNA-directed RNA polymerase subunit alpha